MQCFLSKYIKIVHEGDELRPKHVEPKLWPFWGEGGNKQYTHGGVHSKKGYCKNEGLVTLFHRAF